MWHCQCMKLGRTFSPVKTARKCWEPNQRAPSPKKTFRQFKYWLFLNVSLFCCCCWWWWWWWWCDDVVVVVVDVVIVIAVLFAVLSSFTVSQMFSWFVTLCLMTFYVVGIWYLPWFCHPVFSHFFVPQINGSLNMYVLFFFSVFMFMFVITRPFLLHLKLSAPSLDSRFLHEISSASFKLQGRWTFRILPCQTVTQEPAQAYQGG